MLKRLSDLKRYLSNEGGNHLVMPVGGTTSVGLEIRYQAGANGQALVIYDQYGAPIHGTGSTGGFKTWGDVNVSGAAVLSQDYAGSDGRTIPASMAFAPMFIGPYRFWFTDGHPLTAITKGTTQAGDLCWDRTNTYMYICTVGGTVGGGVGNSGTWVPYASVAAPQVFTTVGDSTWSPSKLGRSQFVAFMVGGGGGGGGTASSTVGSGGGGGGEILDRYYLGFVTADQTVHVPAGGTASNDGGDATIGSLATAKGGRHGLSAGGAGYGGDGSPGGAGSSALVWGSGGGGATAAANGARGGPGRNRAGAGGGAGGGVNFVGGQGGGPLGVAGGTAVTGAGGGGGAQNNAFGAGTAPGNGVGTTGGTGGSAGANTGGGGGGGGAGATPGLGGAGGSGTVIIFQVA